MRTIDYLTDPTLSQLYWPSIVAGVAIAVFCAMLSTLVVLRRLAFIGQGISHAAFGGVGLAAVLPLIGVSAAAQPAGQFAVVFLFCLAAAWTIGLVSERGAGRASAEADTAIGIVLVGSMALGAILLKIARSTRAWESFLFGSIVGVTWIDAGVALCVAVLVIAALAGTRRPMLFWAFDPAAATAFGVRGRRMSLLLLLLLALATVTAMKLAGVVLATAMLVLPGAVALTLSSRMTMVMVLALISALVGVIAGLVVSFEFDMLPGPAIVLVLTGQFAAARAWGAWRGV